jgi:hypothetical protein
MTTIHVLLYVFGITALVVGGGVLGAAIFLAVFNRAIEYAVGRGLNL